MNDRIRLKIRGQNKMKDGDGRFSVYKFIVQHFATLGIVPTLDEIVDNVGLAKSTVRHHIKKLIDYGLLRKLPHHKGQSRQLRIEGTAVAVPRNILAGNAGIVVERNVFIDKADPLGEEIYALMSTGLDFKVEWIQNNFSLAMASTFVQGNAIAFISSKSEHILTGVANGFAVYIPEEVLARRRENATASTN